MGTSRSQFLVCLCPRYTVIKKPANFNNVTNLFLMLTNWSNFIITMNMKE